jgi:DNA-binding CsgD family transcriptional regulator
MAPPDELTPREREVIRAYARTGSQKEAAHHLGITRHTVKVHLANARARAGVASTVQLVDRIAREEGSS